mgnify:CR=1 FL=1
MFQYDCGMQQILNNADFLSGPKLQSNRQKSNLIK